MRRKIHLEPVSIDAVRRTARILGEQSASAAFLYEWDERIANGERLTAVRDGNVLLIIPDTLMTESVQP